MLLALALTLTLANAPPPTQRVEHFDDPVLAAQLLPAGDAVFVTTHRIVAMSADGSRENVAPAGCVPITRAAVSVDGAWVALSCSAPGASGVFRPKSAARVVALPLQAADRFAFCGDALHIARGAAGAEVRTRHAIGAWSDVSADVDGACAADDTWVATPPGARALGPVFGAQAKGAAIAVIDGGALTTSDATRAPREQHTRGQRGENRARSENRRTLVVNCDTSFPLSTCGEGEQGGEVSPSDAPVTGLPYAGTPESGARVGDAWVVVDDGKLLTFPTPFAPTEASGFLVTEERHLWVWSGARAERLVWTPSMATQPKLPPAPPLLLSPPVELRGAFARFREPLLDAVVLFAPSGDDLYGYVLVMSDRRGGSERIDVEACEVASRHWAKHIEGAVVDVAACKRRDRRGVVTLGSDAPSEGLTFRTKVFAERAAGPGVRATLAEMSGYGEGTELWLWRYDPATGDFEAAAGGVPPVLELPGEP